MYVLTLIFYLFNIFYSGNFCFEHVLCVCLFSSQYCVLKFRQSILNLNISSLPFLLLLGQPVNTALYYHLIKSTEIRIAYLQ